MATNQKSAPSSDEGGREATNRAVEAKRAAVDQTPEAGRDATDQTAEVERDTATWLPDVGREMVDAVERVTDDLQRVAQTASRSMGLISEISHPVFDASQQITTEVSQCIQEDARIGADFVRSIFERRSLADLAELQRNLMVRHLRTMVETSERIARINTDAMTKIRHRLTRVA
jgi:hypothetical protein